MINTLMSKTKHALSVFLFIHNQSVVILRKNGFLMKMLRFFNGFIVR